MMKYFIPTLMVIALFYASCETQKKESPQETDMKKNTEFNYVVDEFADLRVLRYKIPGWEKLSLQQKKLVYYLTQAGLEGRDIMWDQNYRHNLEIRTVLEDIVRNYNGDRNTQSWNIFMEYTKRVWFSNGIHHHYANYKFEPEFTKEYFLELLEGKEVSPEILSAMFEPGLDAKKVSLDPNSDLLLSSAVNFYDPDISQSEAEEFYAGIIDKKDPHPISYGLNSKLIRNEDGSLSEDVYKLGGRYAAAIEKMIFWLEKAVEVSENEVQANALKLLIDYYQTGDLRIWDDYNVAWTEATEGDIDYITGFVEVYNDPLGYRGSFETIVQIKDFEASKRMAVVADNVQWFEDNSTIMEEHKKSEVKGVSYKVVVIAGEAGDSSPSTPIGVNLPNANWIRAEHGSKSVSLGNIIEAYDKASGSSYLEEFALRQEEIDRGKKYGSLAGKLHTALHEVVGHASGKLNKGVGTPKETLKNYASTLEEARADLVALYYILDPKLIEIGLMESLDVGKAEYDGYIRNGMMVQLRRLKKGEILEEAHMRNRQLVASWAYEKGLDENVIEKVTKEGRTYFVVNDYDKLRVIFGELLREIQRIKSEGDYEAGSALVEDYGVQVDQAIHSEVLERSKKLNIPPYSGFVNPYLVPSFEGDKIVDIKVEYRGSFKDQMLHYSTQYSNL
jgi:dipeptidyl-peptidase-3